MFRPMILALLFFLPRARCGGCISTYAPVRDSAGSYGLKLCIRLGRGLFAYRIRSVTVLYPQGLSKDFLRTEQNRTEVYSRLKHTYSSSSKHNINMHNIAT